MLADFFKINTAPNPNPLPYWRETQRPFCNLVFLFPIIIFYEFGVGAFGGGNGASIRNGADAWLRIWMLNAGVQLAWVPPLLMLGTFIIWHIATRQPWKAKWDTFGGMVAESFLYAFVLIMLGQVTDFAFRQANYTPLQIGSPTSNLLVRVVTFMGAGIYEEFLFRLCLLPSTYMVFRCLFAPKRWAIVGTITTTSIIFSLAHYLGPDSNGQILALLADAFARIQSSRELWFGFVFRILAGMFFAALYFFRGFGITVGAHATYDVFVGVILVHEI